MNGELTNQRLLRRLERTLDAYGADMARWPADQRAELASFIASDPAAERLHREAGAVDRLLDAASRPDEPAPMALMTRIMADVHADARGARGGPALARQAVIVPLAIGSRLTDAHVGDTIRPSPAAAHGAIRNRPAAARGPWASVAMLAASLVLGIVIGGTGQLAPALESLGVIDGNGVESSGQIVFLAPDDDADDAVGDGFL